MIEQGHDRTYWTHTAKVWERLFESVQEFAKNGQVAPISSMFDGILSCPQRAEPKGSNSVKSFTTPSGHSIHQHLMLVPMPADTDYYKFIPNFLSTFHDMCKEIYIRAAYESGVQGMTAHQGLLEEVAPGGKYWTVLEKAFDSKIAYQSSDCLSEAFCDFTIYEVVYLMFGMNKDPKTWTDSVKTFALGK